DGQVKILDFGLAKLARDQSLGMTTDSSLEESLTQVGVIPGTAVYMSPEQARSVDLDMRSDIFSFGVVLFEMATEMKTDLAQLRIKTGTDPMLRSRFRQASGLHTATKTFQKPSSKLNWIIAGVAAVAFVAVVAIGAWWLKHRVATVEAGSRTIAVLPLQNVSNDTESEFLRFALADEIANALTYTHSLEIRPSASTQKYGNGEADPAKAGRELGVGTVVVGHFLRQKKMVMATLEAVDVKDNKVIWSGTLTSPTDNLIALRNQMAKKVRLELVPALGIGNRTVETSSAPANREGYDLFLRSVAMPHDGAGNKDAIAMLERAVKLDPNY